MTKYRIITEIWDNRLIYRIQKKIFGFFWINQNCAHNLENAILAVNSLRDYDKKIAENKKNSGKIVWSNNDAD